MERTIDLNSPTYNKFRIKTPSLAPKDAISDREREIANYPVGRGLKARILISGESAITLESIEKLIKLLELNKEDLPDIEPSKEKPPED